jgi:hypothetical protein
MGAGGRCPAGKRNGGVSTMAAACGHNSSVLIVFAGNSVARFREAELHANVATAVRAGGPNQ